MAKVKMVESKKRSTFTTSESVEVPTTKRTVLGTVEFAGFAGVNDGGEMVAEALRMGVNEPVTAPNLKHQSRIWGKKLVLTEEEDLTGVVTGNQFSAHRKCFTQVQSDMEGNESVQVDGPSVYVSPENVTGLDSMLPESNHPLSKEGFMLKNMHDNLDRRVDTIDRSVKGNYGWLIALALMIGAVFVGLIALGLKVLA